MSTNRSDGLETRMRLLDAAGLVFAAKGFHDTKIAEICRMANANIAAVNYHFGSKEGLYVEAWRHAFNRSIENHPPDGGVPKSAPAKDRLRGQIVALMHRIMDSDNLEFDIVHKEMANPSGLLFEVMHRSIEPLRQQLIAVVRELLGVQASEQQVRLCEMSIHVQCFAPFFHERRQRERIEHGKPSGLPAMNMDIDVLAEHIFQFSLAGIRSVRGRVASPVRKNHGKII